MPSGLKAALHSVAFQHLCTVQDSPEWIGGCEFWVYQLQLHVQGCGIDEQGLQCPQDLRLLLTV